jgi:uncharacterized protein
VSEGPASLRLAVSDLRGGSIAWERTLESPRVALGEVPEALDGPLSITVRASSAEGTGVRVVGRLSGTATLECRRCLSPVRCEIQSSLEAWFRTGGLAEPEEDSVWPLDPDAAEIDLRQPIREELWLAVPEFALCRPDCTGLCPRCGARLDSEECDCPPEGPDPRWAALEAVRGSLARHGEDTPDTG